MWDTLRRVFPDGLSMRMFVASLATETNTFAPLPVDRSAFERAFYAPPGTHPETPTLCSAPVVAARRRAASDGFTLIEGTSAWAEPAGLVSRASLREPARRDPGAARARRCRSTSRCSGCTARWWRTATTIARATSWRGRAPSSGAEAVIGCELDMHCHLTEKRVDGLRPDRRCSRSSRTPTSSRAPRSWSTSRLRTARGEIRPVAGLFDCRTVDAGFMTSHPLGAPSSTASRRWRAATACSRSPSRTASTPPTCRRWATRSWSTRTATRPRPRRSPSEIGREIIGMRRQAVSPHLKPDESIAVARAHPGRPIVLADRWDNPGGGVPGDGTLMIETLLQHPDLPAAVGVLWDPVAVEFCRAAGVGGRLWLRIGGKATPDLGAARGRPCRRSKALSPDLVIPFEQSLVSLGPAAARLDRRPRRGARRDARPDLQPRGFHRLGHRPCGQEDRRGEVLEPLLRGLLARSRPRSTTSTAAGRSRRTRRKIAYTRVRRPLAPMDPHPWA